MSNRPMDNRTLIEDYFSIRNKRGKTVPFVFNPAQRMYWSMRRWRNIIIKARQKGLSKAIDADQLVDCIMKSTNAVVISHESEATKRLFDAVRFFTKHMDPPPVVSVDNANTLKFAKSGSTYFIGTAGQRAFGRGDTVDRVHLSEAAYYMNLEKSLAGIQEAVGSHGRIDIETTPNGREQVYNLYQKAKAGKSSYTPIFIPWYVDQEYSSANLTPDEQAGLSASVKEMFDVPDKEFVPTKEEEELVAMAKRAFGLPITVPMLKWRRYAVWDLGPLFWQEYPEDDVSCFLQSGRPVFTHVKVQQEYVVDLENTQPEYEEQTDEDIKTGKQKKRIRRYFYGGLDGAEGVAGGDNHCFSVIDAPPGAAARVVFEIANTEPSEVFDLRVATICRTHNISLFVEKNGVGVAHTKELRRLGCKFEEWTTTGTSRPLLFAELERAYRKEELVEAYPAAANEALDMYYNDSNHPAHREGKHDDRVFARAIALQRLKTPKPGIL